MVAHTRERSAARRGRRPASLSPRASGGRGPNERAGAGAAPARRPSALTSSGAILDAVRRYPGLTCEGVAHVTAIATDRVKPHLAAVTESGQLRKVGRTRGTRYHPA